MCLSRHSLFTLSCGLLLFYLACSPNGNEFLSVPQESLRVSAGETRAISGELQEDTTLPEWTVQELNGGVLISGHKGLTVNYKAPSVAGTYHLAVQAQKLDGTKVKQTIPVVVIPRVKVEPASPTARPGGTLTLHATVEGSKNCAVKWSVAPGEGTITSDGVYTAPQQAGSYEVTVTPLADESAVVHVTVAVR